MYAIWWFWFSDGDHGKAHMTSQFNEHQTEFYWIRDYIDSIDPNHNVHQIEFNIRGRTGQGVFNIFINEKYESAGFNTLDLWIPTDSLTPRDLL